MRLTALFREDAITYNPSEGPSLNNPGGGLATKTRMLSLALPNLAFVTEAEQMSEISIIDALWFSGGRNDKDRDTRIDAYRKHKGIKILWTSDLSIFRWLPEHRELILEATDVIAGNSKYMYDVLSNYFGKQKVHLLTDPIDTNIAADALNERKHIIYANSQVLLEKGVDSVISLYRGMPAGTHAERKMQRVFIGSSDTWGVKIREAVAFDLEIELETACTRHHPSLTPAEVMDLACKAWIFVSFARYETFGYALTEAMLGGCHCFVTPHLAYKDRIDAGVITPVNDAKDAQHKIRNLIDSNKPTIDRKARNYVRKNYSLDIFREQLKEIIGAAYKI